MRTSSGSFSNHASGRISNLEFRSHRIRQRLAQLLPVLRIEESPSTELCPAVEAHLESRIVDGESNDVHADIHSLILQVLNRGSRVASARLFAVCQKHDGLSTLHSLQIIEHGFQRRTDRRLRHVRRIELAHHRPNSFAIERLNLLQKITLAIRFSRAECTEGEWSSGWKSFLHQIDESCARYIHASPVAHPLKHAA